MKKFAFFLDIDGTTESGGIIPEENAAAINEAVEKGHYVFICTGRSRSRVGKDILDAAKWSGIIASLGAEIVFDGALIRNKTLSDDLAKKLGAEFLKSGIWLVAGNGDGCIAINHDDIRSVKVYSEEEFNSVLSGITKLDMPPELPEDIVELINQEMKIFYHKNYSEAAIKDVSKADAIEFVLETLGLSRENSVAVGDSVNDIDMFEYAQISVAVENASDEVKKYANMITASNVDCGVAKIIREIIA